MQECDMRTWAMCLGGDGGGDTARAVRTAVSVAAARPLAQSNHPLASNGSHRPTTAQRKTLEAPRMPRASRAAEANDRVSHDRDGSTAAPRTARARAVLCTRRLAHRHCGWVGGMRMGFSHPAAPCARPFPTRPSSRWLMARVECSAPSARRRRSAAGRC